MKRRIKKFFLSNVIIFMLLLTVGFTNKTTSPKTLYRVYLEGKSLGLIKSKNNLENYIDKKQEIKGFAR